MSFNQGVLPITIVEENEQNYNISQVKDIVSKHVDKEMMKTTKGLPIGV